jgi:hypothetical protein
MKKLLALLLIAGLIYWKFFSGPDISKVKIETGDGFVSAETKSTYFEYDLGGKQTSSEYRVVQIDRTSGLLLEMGFAYSASLLARNDYRAFEEIRKAGRCPASFLNGHARNYLLILGDPVQREAFAKAAAKAGDELQLKGRPLTFAMGEVRGRPMKSFNLGGATALYVEQAEVY